MRILTTVILLVFAAANSYSQQDESYRFTVDLNNVVNDQLTIELITPKISESTITYKLPAMVPGTYKVYDFGRFATDFKAFDESGNELTVTKPDINTWDISGADRLYKITYKVNDTYDDTSGVQVFEPVGTSFEEDIFVINNQGLFGYIDGYITNDYSLTFKKPAGFYGSTSLTNLSRNDEEEVFTAPDYQFLVDSPMFFSVPDTTTINFDEASVLISVYSPGKGMKSKDIAESNKDLLEAIRKYLGGKLPTDRYTFLYYFSDNTNSSAYGALEHNYSSLYYMPDVPAAASSYMIKQLMSTNAHEFYHIVTPLNLHSEEIGIFDFNNPVMSKHLWLYEGVTEYQADYIQLREGLMPLKEYLETIQEKLNGASKYNDSLPFTELSKGALDEHENQYLNVYQKGALIGLCLDILIREESGGAQGLQDVINQLLTRYGKDKSFKDDELFGEIESLTSPKVREFLDKYVAGPNRIPYNEIFAKAGIEVKMEPYQVADAGGLQIGFNQENYRLVIQKLDNPDNKFLNELGLKEGDELISFNGNPITFFNAKEIFGSAKKQMKPGDEFQLVVARAGANGSEERKTLNAKIDKTKTAYDYQVSALKSLDERQKMIKEAWLGVK